MKSFLSVTLGKDYPDIGFLSTAKCFGSLASNLVSPIRPYDTVDMEIPLSRAQEEYLLIHFWNSYSWIYPVIDGDEFRAHYDSLWDGTSDTVRRPSALGDIILAVCIQSEAAIVLPQGPRTGFEPYDTTDAVIAGRNLYRRSKDQTLLTDELDGPSITTFQCYLFAVIYLANASFHNMAHSVMALAIRYAESALPSHALGSSY
jgi:hypothetical protein